MDLDACLAVTRTASGGVLATLESPGQEEIDAVLDYTRAVAHASERKAAPIASYAAGLAAAGSTPAQRISVLRLATAALDAAAPEEAH